MPAAAAITLLLGLGLQFALPIRTDLPDPIAVPARHVVSAPLPAVGDYPRVVAASIFSPNRTGGAGGTGVASSAAPAGISAYSAVGVAIGPTVASAIVRGPDGVSHTVRIGGALAGWRLSALERSRLVFTRGGERHALVVGAGPAAAAKPSATAAAAKDGEDDQ